MATAFGHQRLGCIYPFIFLAYGFSGLTGPALGGWIQDQAGGFTLAIVAAAVILALGAAAAAHAGRLGPGGDLAAAPPLDQPQSAAMP